MQLHTDVIAPVILGTTGILFFAVVGRFTARYFNQPSVLGELLVGILIGVLGYTFSIDFIEILREGPIVFDIVGEVLSGDSLEHAATTMVNGDYSRHLLEILSGPHGQDYFKVAQAVDIFSRYGVIFMLFLIGLETSLADMRKVGRDSTLVATIGVVVPFALGVVLTLVLLPEIDLQVDLFIAATLVATSVGITARVLKDINRMQTRSARVILGAAVIDDVLGLIMLAIVTGIIVSGSVDLLEIGLIIVMSALFFAVAFYFGPYFLKYIIWLVRHLDLVEAKIFISFLFVMALAWIANLIGLATIIGAFTAGVILHDGYFHHWGDEGKQSLSIKDLIAPLETILVPIFFVLMGIQVKLETLLEPNVILIAVLLTVIAIVGKLVSGLGARRASNRLAIGIGMMPRGEVGLIFASLGKSLGVISDSLFSSIVIMVLVTTLITPPLLKFAVLRCDKGNDCEDSEKL
ncbi:MAG: cation:proton antiporter [Thioalkalispiraceae bacterium]|jgi:Kef-type K+ transport system membrane component KefB